jgi:hypothetical protein
MKVNITCILFSACKKSETAKVFSEDTYNKTKTPSLPITGYVSYSITQKSNPSVDELDAYKRIKIVMDSATYLYNRYTTFTKALTIEYNANVQTADGNSNGTIRFGSGRQYMKVQTAMHEMAHTMGVGTTTQWKTKLIVNGLYTGPNAISVLKALASGQILQGDAQHFWPGGLNYANDSDTEADLIFHCKIVNSMKADGL